MIEFDTNEDLHTIMQYTRQVCKSQGHNGPVFVDIDRLAELNEFKCKLLAEIFLLSLGLPVIR